MSRFHISLKKTDHLVTTPDKHSHRPRVGALLNNKHLIPCSTKGKFSDDTGVTELVGGKIFESGDNSTVGGNGDKLI